MWNKIVDNEMSAVQDGTRKMKDLKWQPLLILFPY